MTIRFVGDYQRGGEGQVISVDPTATYLRTSADSGATDAQAIALASLGLTGGDRVIFQTVGSYDLSEGGTSDELFAVFSENSLLRVPTVRNRVRDAVAANDGLFGGVSEPVPTGPTSDGGATDIAEDFFVTFANPEIPETATHLFLSTETYTRLGGHSDADHDFGLYISKPTMIGLRDVGSLIVTDGFFATDGLFVGVGDVSVGNVVFRGESTEVRIGGRDVVGLPYKTPGNVAVGLHGRGNLDIVSGANLSIAFGGMDVGGFGSGRVSVAGEGSAINLFGFGDHLSVIGALGGEGALLISSGGRVEGAVLNVGGRGTGTVIVKGEGSELITEGGFVAGVTSGVGVLKILDGAQLINDPTSAFWVGVSNIGSTSPGSSFIEVNGYGNAGTLFDAGHELNIGINDTASGPTQVLALNGGVVRADIIRLEDSATIGGDGTFEGDVQVREFGTIDPGGKTRELTIDGSLQNQAAHLKIDIDGPNRYDRLHVTGDISLTWGLTVDVVTRQGFALEPGVSFDVLHVDGSIGGAFEATVNGSSEFGYVIARKNGDVTFTALSAQEGLATLNLNWFGQSAATLFSTGGGFGGGSSDDLGDFTFHNVSLIVGTSGDDETLTVDPALEISVEGRGGNDKIVTGGTAWGGAGDDYLSASVVVGGAGADELFGKVVDYTNTRGVTIDLLNGTAGRAAAGDIIHETSRPASIMTIRGSDSHADLITGDSEANRFEGNGGDDGLNGLDGNDELYGGAGDDQLDGGFGSDTVNGGAGNDVLSGGERAASSDYIGDKLYGGAGKDIFQFRTINDSGTPDNGTDTIRDFKSGHDLIDLSSIDAQPDTPEHDALAFIGTAAFSGAGQIRYEHVGNRTVILVNNADIAAVMQIDLLGHVDLEATDFLL